MNVTYIIFYNDTLLVLTNKSTLHKTQTSLVKLPTSNDIHPKLKANLHVVTQTADEIVAKITSEATLNDVKVLTETPLQFELIKLRQVLNFFTIETIHKISYYYQFIHYQDKNKFCGLCGKKTITNTYNKFITCTHCKREIYPHIAPCIIVRIHKEDKILLARGINFTANHWGLIAGFIELDDVSLEEAVKREVKEEIGIEIENLNYWGSQNWPFPTSAMLMGFTATYKSGDLKFQEDEIIEANFFARNEIPGLPSLNYSLTMQMITQWLKQK